MRILHLSDTHGCHRRLGNLPEADIVVHSGDFCMAGSEREAIDFLNWFCNLPYLHKIFICGNHDECLYGSDITGLDSNVHYLCNSRIEIEGLKFYGVPMFFTDCFTDHQQHNYEAVPLDTDILITHAPANGILDLDGSIHLGSKDLLKKLDNLDLKAHLFGHVHARKGIETRLTPSGKTTIHSNGAIINATYTATSIPNLIEL
jgi:Icc-related predicted phosphoesterase